MLGRAFALIASSLLTVSPALADLHVETRLTCPAAAVPGATIVVDLLLINSECRPLDVRILSSILGNADDTAGGIGIFGPVVATDPPIPVPAAMGTPVPCDLTTNRCGGFGHFCQTDSDCSCFTTTPSITNVSVATPPPIPLSLAGTVATYLFVSEWEGGKEIETNECLVNIPEPSQNMLLLSGVIGLLALSLRRAVWSWPIARGVAAGSVISRKTSKHKEKRS